MDGRPTITGMAKRTNNECLEQNEIHRFIIKITQVQDHSQLPFQPIPSRNNQSSKEMTLYPEKMKERFPKEKSKSFE